MGPTLDCPTKCDNCMKVVNESYRGYIESEQWSCGSGTKKIDKWCGVYCVTMGGRDDCCEPDGGGSGGGIGDWVFVLIPVGILVFLGILALCARDDRRHDRYSPPSSPLPTPDVLRITTTADFLGRVRRTTDELYIPSLHRTPSF